MPSEKFGFTPATLKIQGSDFVKVRSFSDQVKHVAQANYSIAATITGAGLAANADAISKLKTKAEILAALTDSFTVVRRPISTITPANANDIVDDPGVGQNQTKTSEAAWVAVHGYDHYGQLWNTYGSTASFQNHRDRAVFISLSRHWYAGKDFLMHAQYEKSWSTQ